MGAYVVSETHFRGLRARGAREAFLVYVLFIWGSRQFQRAIARPHWSTCATNQHNIYYYIDTFFWTEYFDLDLT